MTLRTLRGSALALVAACAAWAGGCATAKPLVDPVFSSGAYAPARIAVMPPDVFVVLDQAGDNDDAASAALGAAVSNQTVAAVERALRARGYDVDLSSRWDGIVAKDGSVLVSRDELGWLANGVLQFANQEDDPDKKPAAAGAPSRFVAPELAAKVGWATQSDAVLYINVKGVETTNGKRAESIVAGVFIAFVIAVIVLAMVASSKHGGNSSGSGLGGGAKPAPSTGAWRGTPSGAASAPATGTWRGTPPANGLSSGGGAWRGNAVSRPAGAPVYGGGYGGGPQIGVGIFIPLGPVGGPVPLDGPAATHDGNVTHEDELFAGDELYVSMTLVATYDGRVLWHARQDLDLDADDPRDVQRMVQSFLGQLPARGAPAAAAPAKP